ncbi:hypothetical protein D7X94_01290 [Acutalibacter sp. 1XD8-33]|uniref:hypothetical protein n=1 Tax=Acutalibacter sp. 1XD8-33 TaxID=2320081 RepID=UPI000EA03F04|nr:hypothetical protein [Acutalibacter sp. 1XD8-33]RKJ42137.1 hypothetical protein D7X94_01290 [Acutalibacter sp. 1XD8-33]
MRERVIDWVCAHKLIVVAFILLALILIWLWPVSVYSGNAADIEKIHLFDGNTGKSVSITNREEIDKIVTSLQKVPLRRSFDLRVLIPSDGIALEFVISKKNSNEKSRFQICSDKDVKKTFLYHAYQNEFPYEYYKSLCQSTQQE